MWPFTKRKENEDEILDRAIDELDCHLHQQAYIACLQEKKRSYKKCLNFMDNYRYCLAMARQKQTEATEKKSDFEKIINPQLFSETS